MARLKVVGSTILRRRVIQRRRCSVRGLTETSRVGVFQPVDELVLISHMYRALIMFHSASILDVKIVHAFSALCCFDHDIRRSAYV